MSEEAPTLPCSSCGAPLRVDPIAPSARCTHCSAVTAVPDALRARVRAYRSAIKAEMKRISASDRLRLAMEPDVLDKYSNWFFVVIFGLAGVLTVGQMTRDFRGLSMGVFLGGLAGAMLVFFVLVWRETTRAGSAGAEPEPPPVAVEIRGSVSGRCSSCGGSVTFQIGTSTARCPFCNATVLPTEAQQAALVRVAQERADLEEARAGRAGHRRQPGDGPVARGLNDAAKAFRVALPAGILGALGVVFLSIGGQHTRGGSRAAARAARDVNAVFRMIGAGLLGVALLIVFVALAIAYASRRFSARGKLDRAVRELARGRMARVARDAPLAVLDWLDACWSVDAPMEVVAPVPKTDDDPGSRWVISTSQGASAALIVVSLSRLQRRTDVFLAAYARREAWREAARCTEAEELRRAGFEVEVCRAGVRASFPEAGPSAVGAERIAWVLARCAAIAAQPASLDRQAS